MTAEVLSIIWVGILFTMKCHFDGVCSLNRKKVASLSNNMDEARSTDEIPYHKRKTVRAKDTDAYSLSRQITLKLFGEYQL